MKSNAPEWHVGNVSNEPSRSLLARSGVNVNLCFHQEVLHSIETYGRTHKLEIMLRFRMKTRHYLKDLQTGLRMLAKRKLDLRPSKVMRIHEIKAIFNSRVQGMKP